MIDFNGLSSEGLQHGLQGIVLVQEGLMWLRYLEVSPNSAAAAAALEKYTDWEYKCGEWRRQLVRYDPLPMAMADINENLLYLADKFTKL
jgi:hypothetical protein